MPEETIPGLAAKFRSRRTVVAGLGTTVAGAILAACGGEAAPAADRQPHGRPA